MIISADSHMLESDCWVDRFPEHLKDQAPRMEFIDGGWHLSVAGRPMTPPQLAADLCMTLECTPGFTDIEARLADLDVEGVEKELIFPQRLFGLFMFGEMMNRPETFGAYNEHIAEACAAGKGRLFPVMIPNYWDLTGGRASVDRCQALGARCLMVPIKPGKDVDGEPIQYSDPKLDPLWDAVAQSASRSASTSARPSPPPRRAPPAPSCSPRCRASATSGPSSPSAASSTASRS